MIPKNLKFKTPTGSVFTVEYFRAGGQVRPGSVRRIMRLDGKRITDNVGLKLLQSKTLVQI